MKKFTAILLLLVFLVLWGCASNLVVEGKVYETYGLFNKDEVRNPAMEYRLVWGNAILGALFFETAIAPIYFFGFSIWEPVGFKHIERM